MGNFGRITGQLHLLLFFKGKIGCLDVIVTFITASCVVFVIEAAVLNEPEVILFTL